MADEENKPTAEEEAQKTADEAAATANTDATAEADKEKQQAKLDAEIAAKEAKKANLDKALTEAEEILQKKRDEAKRILDIGKDPDPVPQIDDNDPAAKAWNQRIKDNVAPITESREAEKAEIRKFTIKEFLADKPAVARDPEKVAELIGMYDRIKENTGLTKEGVLIDLNKAFGAIYHEQLIDAARTQKFDRVKEMELFSSPGVDQGATGYVNEEVKMPSMSADDRKILAQWGMTPEEWWETKKSTSNT